MGAPGRRPGPSADRLIPTHHIALTGARPAGQGPVRSVSPCHSMVSGCRPSCFEPSPTRGTRPPPRSRARPSPSSSRAATCSPAPRPAPARRPRSCCRSSTASTRPGATPARPATRSASSWSSRPASWRSRSRSRSAPTAPTGPIRSATVYGGVGFGPQVSKLRAGPEIVVATPGRLLDHLGQGTINLSQRRGPRPRRGRPHAGHGLHPRHPQDPGRAAAEAPEPAVLGDLLATTSRQLADGLLTNPAHVQVTPRNTTTELIDQLVIPVDRERKRDLLRELVALDASRRPWSSRGRSTARTGSRSSCAGTASRRPPSTATAASPSA